MKFSEIRFTHPRVVFPGGFGHGAGESVGFLSTRNNDVTRKIESIEAAGVWLVITRAMYDPNDQNKFVGYETRCVPASAVENATPEEDPSLTRALLAAGEQQTRGPRAKAR
jgi:hypothetical protein